MLGEWENQEEPTEVGGPGVRLTAVAGGAGRESLTRVHLQDGRFHLRGMNAFVCSTFLRFDSIFSLVGIFESDRSARSVFCSMPVTENDTTKFIFQGYETFISGL